jgi:chitodextrinase
MARRWLPGVLFFVLAGCGGGGSSGVDCDAATAACLSWTASPSPEVVGYRIYFGTTSRIYTQDWGAGVDAGRAEHFAISGLVSGTRYYFAVTAYDRFGNQSGFSNEVGKLMP